MTSELDIFVGNTTLIDEDVYRLWLDGYSGLCSALPGSCCLGWEEGACLGLRLGLGKWTDCGESGVRIGGGGGTPGEPLWSYGSAHSSVNDAVALRVRSGILEQTGATTGVLQSDTMDHYRTFHMLERLLHAPPKLLHQLIFQIPPSRQALLIERCAPGEWRGCQSI